MRDPWARTTYSHASDWPNLAPSAVRAGKSAAVEETHEPCLLCGGVKPLGCEYHAPRVLIRGGRHVRVDCSDREVPP